MSVCRLDLPLLHAGTASQASGVKDIDKYIHHALWTFRAGTFIASVGPLENFDGIGSVELCDGSQKASFVR